MSRMAPHSRLPPSFAGATLAKLVAIRLASIKRAVSPASRLIWALAIAIALTPLRIVSDANVKFDFLRCLLIFLGLAIAAELLAFIISRDIPGLAFLQVEKAEGSAPAESGKAPEQHGDAGGWRGILLFAVLVTAEILGFVWLAHERRVVFSHDIFGIFATQYFFLDHVATTGYVPQWLPFLNTGFPAGSSQIINLNFCNQLLMFLPPLVRHVDFLNWFYLGFFVDVLFLTVGIWLMSLYFLRSNICAFFCSVSGLGSCVWIKSPYFGFHLWYTIPLVIYLVHRFFDSAHWRYLYCAAALLLAQYIGNLPYFFPFQCLFLLVYFGIYFACNSDRARAAFRTLLDLRVLPLSVGLGIGVFILFWVTNDSLANIFIGDRPRTRDFNLVGFLTSGGPQFTGVGWLELITRASPNFGVSLYVGILAAFLIPAGVYFAWREGGRHIVIVTGFLISFGLGTIVTAVAFYAWPTLDYMRYIGLTAQGAAITLSLIAGYGLRAMLAPRSGGIIGYRCATLTALLLLYVLLLALAVGAIQPLLLAQAVYGTAGFFKEFADVASPERLVAMIRQSLLFFGTLACLFFLLSRFRKTQVKDKAWLVGVALLSFHVADVGLYHAAQLRLWSYPLGADSAPDTDYRPVRFAEARSFAPDPQETRWRLLEAVPLPSHVLYEMAKGYLLADWTGPEIRSHSWDKFVDVLIKAFPRVDFGDVPSLLPSSDAAKRVFGVKDGVLQFFQQASIVSPDAARDEFRATVDRCPGTLIVESQGLAGGVGANCAVRLPLNYEVMAFDANQIKLRVLNDSGAAAWLYYANAWDEGWQAQVNAELVPVYRANLAYQAVELQPGDNVVWLHFRSRVATLITVLGFVLSGVAIFVLIFAMSEIAMPSKSSAASTPQ